MRFVVLPAAVAALLLAGCSGGTEAEPELDIDRAPSSAAAPDKSEEPRSGGKGRDDKAGDNGVEVEVGALPGGGARRAAAEAYADYLEVRAQAFHTVGIDLAKLSAVAVGEALQDVQGGVSYRSREKLHMVGDLEVSVSQATVRGRTARVTACLTNGTAEADRSGRVVEQDPPPFYRSRAQLRRFGPDVWLVSSVDYEEVTGC